MEKYFRDVMSKQSAKELIKIVTLDSASYQLAALEAADGEIRKRNINIEQIYSSPLSEFPV